MRRLLVPGLCAIVSVSAGCRFDGGGITDDGDLAGPDAAAAADAAVDATPPDAAVPPDANPPPPPDTDLDGAIDADDNCAAVANPEQHDEDDDAVGDVCDNCPHVANASQVSGDGDPVGDACDPEPGLAGDVITFFDGFNGTARDAAWLVGAGADTWMVSDGSIRQSETTRELKILYLSAPTVTRGTVAVALTPSSVPEAVDRNDSSRTVGLITGYARGADGVGAGRYTLVADQLADDALAYVVIGSQAADGDTVSAASSFLPGPLTTQRYRLSVDLTSLAQDAIGFDAAGASATASQAIAATTGRIGLRTRSVAAGFEYVVVIGAP